MIDRVGRNIDHSAVEDSQAHGGSLLTEIMGVRLIDLGARHLAYFRATLLSPQTMALTQLKGLARPAMTTEMRVERLSNAVGRENILPAGCVIHRTPHVVTL